MIVILFCKLVYELRHHIKDLCDTILILDIDQTRGAVLDHKHRRGLDPTAHTTAGIVGMFFCKCTSADTKAHVHQRKNDRIPDVDGISHHRL